MTLNNAIINKTYQVNRVDTSGLMKERLLAFGFIPGNIVHMVHRRNQIAIYEISKGMIALRDEEAKLIAVDENV